MPDIVACAIVHDDPPEVFIAEDIETLNWILALKLYRPEDVALAHEELQFSRLFLD